MSKGKFFRKSGFNVRPLILMLAVALLIGATIGGTIAWLTAKTDDVVNTFTVGDVNITLKETKIIWEEVDGKETGNYSYDPKGPQKGVQNTYKLIPGEQYTKDPVVAVVDSESGLVSEDCYLFVQVVEENNPSKYLEYGYVMNGTESGWMQLDQTVAIEGGPVTTVWYRIVEKTDSVKSFELLKDNTVTVKETILKSGSTGDVVMPAADKQPKLEFTAYAIQKDNTGTAAEAWAKIPK